MTYDELQERINNRTLKTRNGLVVRNLEKCLSYDGNPLYNVYVENIGWCLVTVNAKTGLQYEGEENDEDLIY